MTAQLRFDAQDSAMCVSISTLCFAVRRAFQEQHTVFKDIA